jgi:predicted nucleic acid-binding protein
MDEKIIVIDSSVIIKIIASEADSDAAVKIFDNLEKNKTKIILPNIVFLEILNALFFGQSKLNSVEIEKAINHLFNFNLEIVQVEKDIIAQTTKIMCDFKITSYDALFVALAASRNCVLLTADRKHHKKEIYSKIKYL